MYSAVCVAGSPQRCQAYSANPIEPSTTIAVSTNPRLWGRNRMRMIPSPLAGGPAVFTLLVPISQAPSHRRIQQAAQELRRLGRQTLDRCDERPKMIGLADHVAARECGA